jgi:hypothetical protein
MNMAFLLVHENGSFVFSRDMHQGDIQDDDVYFNLTTQDIMTVSNSGLPFRVGHKIHLDIFQPLLLALSSPRSLVVDINSSSCFFQFLLRST